MIVSWLCQREDESIFGATVNSGINGLGYPNGKSKCQDLGNSCSRNNIKEGQRRHRTKGGLWESRGGAGVWRLSWLQTLGWDPKGHKEKRKVNSRGSDATKENIQLLQVSAGNLHELSFTFMARYEKCCHRVSKETCKKEQEVEGLELCRSPKGHCRVGPFPMFPEPCWRCDTVGRSFVVVPGTVVCFPICKKKWWFGCIPFQVYSSVCVLWPFSALYSCHPRRVSV